MKVTLPADFVFLRFGVLRFFALLCESIIDKILDYGKLYTF